MKVEVFTKNNCPFCEMAKMLLLHKGIEFEENNLDGDIKAFEKLFKRSGMKTMPQIFVEDTLIGGYDDLKMLDESGKLDTMLSGQDD